MAITPNTAYHFLFGTLAEYKAAKAASKLVATDLYFITDTHQLYVGDDLYTQGTEFVTAFPEAPAAGIIYVNTTTKEVKVHDGTQWNQMVAPTSTALTASTTDTDLVTAKAIRDYIKGLNDDNVTDVTYDAATQKFTVAYAGKDSAELALKNLFTNVAYDGTTGKMTFTKANKAEGETDLVLNLPVENFLANAEYNKTTHILTLTLTDGTKFDVDLSDLIDAYTVSDTASVDLTMTNNNITADVKISSKDGNAVSIVTEEGKQGLYVAEDYVQSIDDTNSVDLTVTDHKLTADVKISTVENNSLVIKSDEGREGLFVDISGKQDNLTEAQLNAVNSGITSTKVGSYDSHIADADIHVTADQKTAWTAKQDALTTDQLAAVNSGITAEKLATALAKQDALSEAQLAACNSGITAAKVATYDGYATTIAGKADKATTLAGYGITDAYTKTEVDALAQWKAIPSA